MNSKKVNILVNSLIEFESVNTKKNAMEIARTFDSMQN